MSSLSRVRQTVMTDLMCLLQVRYCSEVMTECELLQKECSMMMRLRDS